MTVSEKVIPKQVIPEKVIPEKKIPVFIAKDGKEFSREKECLDWEKIIDETAEFKLKYNLIEFPNDEILSYLTNEWERKGWLVTVIEENLEDVVEDFYKKWRCLSKTDTAQLKAGRYLVVQSYYEINTYGPCAGTTMNIYRFEDLISEFEDKVETLKAL